MKKMNQDFLQTLVLLTMKGLHLIKEFFTTCQNREEKNASMVNTGSKNQT